jgi:hypothetical protein
MQKKERCFWFKYAICQQMQACSTRHFLCHDGSPTLSANYHQLSKKKKKKKKKTTPNVLLGKLHINPLNYNLIVNISSNYQLYQSPPSKLSKNVNVSPKHKKTLKKIINFFFFLFNFFNFFFLKKKFSFFFFKFFFSNL